MFTFLNILKFTPADVSLKHSLPTYSLLGMSPPFKTRPSFFKHLLFSFGYNPVFYFLFCPGTGFVFQPCSRRATSRSTSCLRHTGMKFISFSRLRWAYLAMFCRSLSAAASLAWRTLSPKLGANGCMTVISTAR